MARDRENQKQAGGVLLSPIAKKIARNALIELGEGEVGRHIGIGHMGRNVATHRFEANVAGYNGWEWNAVLACADGSRYITVSELALVPGRRALQAPEWVPYEQRIQPGDLGPGDEMPPAANDERLTTSEADAALDRGTEKKLSVSGLKQAEQRWLDGETGPGSSFAKKAKRHCSTCAFYLPLVGSRDFGACANEFSADGMVVSSRYGCGAHSDTPPVDEFARAENGPFDDEKPLHI